MLKTLPSFLSDPLVLKVALLLYCQMLEVIDHERLRLKVVLMLEHEVHGTDQKLLLVLNCLRDVGSFSLSRSIVKAFDTPKQLVEIIVRVWCIVTLLWVASPTHSHIKQSRISLYFSLAFNHFYLVVFA